MPIIIVRGQGRTSEARSVPFMNHTQARFHSIHIERWECFNCQDQDFIDIHIFGEGTTTIYEGTVGFLRLRRESQNS